MSDQGESQSQPSIRDRIGAILSPPQEQAPEPPEQVSEASETSEVETQEPEVQEAQAQPDPTADWVEVELDGDKIVIPPKFREAFLKNADYTQKTQAIAEHRKVVEMREQSLIAQEQTLQQLQPLYGRATQIEGYIQQLERLNWEALYEQDPMLHNTKRADYALLLQQRQEIQNQIGQGRQYLEQQRSYATAEAVKAADPIIRKAVPDWSTEKSNALGHFALKHGATPAELAGLAARPWAVILMEKARLYDELQASKAQLPKKVQHLSPVAKPGAKSSLESSGQASYRKNQEALRKSGGKDPVALRALVKAKLGT